MSAPARAAGLLAGAVVGLLVLIGTAGPAAAHPLGNFTVNRYAAIEVSAEAVRVTYVLDLAEVPAFQARDELASDPDGYRAEQVAAIEEGLVLEVDGRPLDLRPLESRLAQPEGQGGLETIRLSVLFEATLPDVAPDQELRVMFADRNGGGRIGWREIVVDAAGDARVVESSVPAEDVSDALRSYPEDRLRSPLDVSDATFRFTPGSEEVAAQPLDAAEGGTRRGDRFTELLDRQRLTPLVLAGMLGVAALVGVGHALAPGHGKTVMAAYLIGTRGRPVDAVLLGVIVSAMHTTSVLVLGIALYQLDERFALDRIYPVLTLVSGIGVLVVGVWLATTRLRTYRRPVQAAPDEPAVPVAAMAGGGSAPVDGGVLAPQGPAGPERAQPGRHLHDHDGHDHPHEHDHPHDHDHDGHDHQHDHDDPHDQDRRLDHDGHDHPHDHDDPHEHEHEHDHDRHDPVGRHRHGPGVGHRHGPGGHTHDLPEGVAPLSKRGLLLLATAGGIVPSPSAVIVLVSAFTLGRIGLGLALVAAFSVGLALTLTAVGLALVLGSRAIGGRGSARLVRVFPVLGAVALLVLGLVLTFQGVRGL